MRKIIFFQTVGYCGMDGNSSGSYPDDVTDEQLNEDAYQLALNNAEMYGYYQTEDLYQEEDEESGDNYSSNIEGWWEDYDPEKHDGLVPGGGEWTWNWEE